MSQKMLIKGNEALARAAIKAGCKYFFGYPITPQTEIGAYMSRKMPEIGGTFIQAESEIAACNMLFGCAAAGKRAMTSSSSPGISLKTECISYMAACDIPAVIVNVQRGGPGLGGIQPSQSDYWQATRAAGHGDFRLIVLAPSTVQEMADFTQLAFNLADKYRNPAMILADGLIGQMMEAAEIKEPETVPPEKPWAVNGHNFKRKHNIINSLILDPKKLEELNFERFKKYDVIKQNEQRSESYLTEDADIVLVSFGASARISEAAVDMAREHGIKAGLIRPVTLWPYPVDEIKKTAETAKRFLTVEMNMGQMVDDVRLAVNGKCPVDFYGRTGGIIPAPEEVFAAIKRSMERVIQNEYRL